METMTLGAFLRESRGTRTLSEVHLAGGPDQGNLSRYEREERLPQMSVLRWLCTYYGVSFDAATDLWGAAQARRARAALDEEAAD